MNRLVRRRTDASIYRERERESNNQHTTKYIEKVVHVKVEPGKQKERLENTHGFRSILKLMVHLWFLPKIGILQREWNVHIHSLFSVTSSCMQ